MKIMTAEEISNLIALEKMKAASRDYTAEFEKKQKKDESRSNFLSLRVRLLPFTPTAERPKCRWCEKPLSQKTEYIPRYDIRLADGRTVHITFVLPRDEYGLDDLFCSNEHGYFYGRWAARKAKKEY